MARGNIKACYFIFLFRGYTHKKKKKKINYNKYYSLD